VTLHLPTRALRLLVPLGVVAVVIAAFFLGRSSTSGSPSSDEAPVCNERSAKKATLGTGFAEEIQKAGEISAALDGTAAPAPMDPFFHDRRGFRVEALKCVDLGRSHGKEMVVGLGGGAGGRIFHWAVFTPDHKGGWRLIFSRSGVPAERLTPQGGVLIELTPTYEEGDPLCCPSGRRAASFDFIGRDFRMASPRSSGTDRLIVVEADGISRIGPLDARSATPVDAQVAFGRPSWVLQDSGEVCTMTWSNLGLEIVFANLGGEDPCGPAGAIGSFEVNAVAGAQAGWRTSEGARLGMSTQELLRLYPAAGFQRGQFVLVSVPTPFGETGVTPALSATMFEGDAASFHGYVGAAGE
jgi:hypothetical protein